MKQNDNLIQSQYSGDNVEGYESKRSKSPRWKREVEIFTGMVESEAPKTLLDCPVGTCRWAVEYASLKLDELYGLDASDDMLVKATESAKKAGIADFSFKKANLLSDEYLEHVPRVDLIACIRFLNWVNADEAELIVRNLTKVGSKSMLLGISLIPSSWSTLRKIRSKFRLRAENRRRLRRGLSPVHVHDEKWFEDLMKKHAWKTTRREQVFNDRIRINFFILLTRDQK
jgi:hypothetical protein